MDKTNEKKKRQNIRNTIAYLLIAFTLCISLQPSKALADINQVDNNGNGENILYTPSGNTINWTVTPLNLNSCYLYIFNSDGTPYSNYYSGQYTIGQTDGKCAVSFATNGGGDTLKWVLSNDSGGTTICSLGYMQCLTQSYFPVGDYSDVDSNVAGYDSVDYQFGCTISTANNYNSSANLDNATCIIPGCSYSEATNYDSTLGVNVDDHTCTFPDFGGSGTSTSCMYSTSTLSISETKDVSNIIFVMFFIFSSCGLIAYKIIRRKK